MPFKNFSRKEERRERVDGGEGAGVLGWQRAKGRRVL